MNRIRISATPKAAAAVSLELRSKASSVKPAKPASTSSKDPSSSLTPAQMLANLAKELAGSSAVVQKISVVKNAKKAAAPAVAEPEAAPSTTWKPKSKSFDRVEGEVKATKKSFRTSSPSVEEIAQDEVAVEAEPYAATPGDSKPIVKASAEGDDIRIEQTTTITKVTTVAKKKKQASGAGGDQAEVFELTSGNDKEIGKAEAKKLAKRLKREQKKAALAAKKAEKKAKKLAKRQEKLDLAKQKRAKKLQKTKLNKTDGGAFVATKATKQTSPGGVISIDHAVKSAQDFLLEAATPQQAEKAVAWRQTFRAALAGPAPQQALRSSPQDLINSLSPLLCQQKQPDFASGVVIGELCLAFSVLYKCKMQFEGSVSAYADLGLFDSLIELLCSASPASIVSADETARSSIALALLLVGRAARARCAKSFPLVDVLVTIFQAWGKDAVQGAAAVRILSTPLVEAGLSEKLLPESFASKIEVFCETSI